MLFSLNTCQANSICIGFKDYSTQARYTLLEALLGIRGPWYNSQTSCKSAINHLCNHKRVQLTAYHCSAGPPPTPQAGRILIPSVKLILPVPHIILPVFHLAR